MMENKQSSMELDLRGKRRSDQNVDGDQQVRQCLHLPELSGRGRCRERNATGNAGREDVEGCRNADLLPIKVA